MSTNVLMLDPLALVAALMMRRGKSGMPEAVRRAKRPPHIGAREQERAKRCYMVATYPNGTPRSAPTMCQMSKRAYEMRVEAERDARYG